jgi:hypothetical protein
MWGFDEDDAFVPVTFGSSSAFSLFASERDPDPDPAEFTFQTPFQPQPAAQVGRPGPCFRDPQTLMDENNALRQTELSMRTTYAERLSQNERLKRQLEECRTRFMTALTSGITNPNRS